MAAPPARRASSPRSQTLPALLLLLAALAASRTAHARGPADQPPPPPPVLVYDKHPPPPPGLVYQHQPPPPQSSVDIDRSGGICSYLFAAPPLGDSGTFMNEQFNGECCGSATTFNTSRWAVQSGAPHWAQHCLPSCTLRTKTLLAALVGRGTFCTPCL